MEKKKKFNFFRKWKHKYRLIIYNDNTFEEVLYFRLSRFNVALLVVVGSFLIVLITTFIIAYTPLREYIPGYPDAEAIQKAKLNEMFIDSIKQKIELNEKYLNNIKHLLRYNEPLPLEVKQSTDTTINYKNLNLSASREDSLFRKKVEQEEKYSITFDKNIESLFVQYHYFTPTKGVIINKFNKPHQHFGIDIATKAKERVFSILDGHVIYAGYTSESGYMIIIQHKEQLLSVYKHLDQIFTEVSQKVSAGEIIGIVGNTGELSTGPHLHFELWHKGQPINPEYYMNF